MQEKTKIQLQEKECEPSGHNGFNNPGPSGVAQTDLDLTS